DRPVRAIDTCLRSLGAAPQAGGPLGARVEPAIFLSRDCIWSRPPVPAEVVVRLGHAPAHPAEWDRWHGRTLAVRERGVARQSRHSPIPLGAHVVGLEVLIRE